MPFSTDAVANYFLKRANEEGNPLTPMKLQKLIYFAHGWHLALHPDGKPLVNENVQAWAYGPVFPSTYHEFKDLGNRPIDRMAVSVVYENSKIVISQPSIESDVVNKQDVEFAQGLLDRIWKVYGSHTAASLSNKTHEEGSPWWTVRREAMNTSGTIPKGLNIPDQLIRAYFDKSRKTAG